MISNRLLQLKGSDGISVIRKDAIIFTSHLKQKRFMMYWCSDTVVSYIASGIARNEEFSESVELANEAAGISVGKFGTQLLIVQKSKKEILDYKVQNS